MTSSLRVGILSSIITAALVYVVLESRQPPPAPDSQVLQADLPNVAYASPPNVMEATTPPPRLPVERPPDLKIQISDEQNNTEIYRKYSRSVVNVASRTYTYNFFLQAVPAEGVGSGVVIDNDGHIVTNYHVIQNANAEIEVKLWNQSRYRATVVGTDPNNDLALIRVDAPDIDWVPLPLGTTQGLQVGQKVLAIGNPFGLSGTLSTGIISSLGRSLQIPVQRGPGVIEGIIQTDAAINQGNSGGPMLNTDGKLIGINTAIVSGATGIGFAIPVETVKRVTSDLLTYGRVRRVYLGVQSVSLSDLPGLGEQLGLGTETGVLIVALIPASPATDAGLRGPTSQVRYGNYIVRVGGDVVASIDGRTIRSSTDIGLALEPHRPGDQVAVTIFRDGQELDLQVTLQEEAVLQ